MVPGWQYYWNPWFRERRVYRVPLSVADCRERLKAGTKFRLRGPVARLWFTRGLWLHRRRFPSGNAFEPCAHVRFRRARDGTEVRVTIKMRPFVRAFVTLWVGFAVFFAVELVIRTVPSGSWRDLVFSLLPGIALVLGGLLVFVIGRLLARNDPEILLAYIESRLLS